MIRKQMITTLLLWGIVVLVIAGLFGCAGKKPIWGDPDTGFLLSYRLEPGLTWQYDSSTDQNTNMEVMGRSMETNTDIGVQYSVKCNQIKDDQSLSAEVTFDKMNIKVNSAQGENTMDMSKLEGKSFEMVFTPKGEELEYPGLDKLPAVDFGQMGGKRGANSFFRNPLPDLPNKPIKIGESWTSKQKFSQDQGNMNVNVDIDITNTVDGYETINGQECLKINAKYKGTIDGTGSQMGADLVLEGDTDGTSMWYFDYKKGALVQSSSNMFLEGTVAVSGQTNMTIPMTQETKTEIKLIPNSK